MPMRTYNRRVRERIGEAVRVRRAELRMTQEQLAVRAEVSLRTVQNTEAGLSVIRPVTRGHLETALGWETGTITRMYDTLAGDEEAPDPVTGYAPELDEILNHPGLDDFAKDMIRRELEQIHSDFAQKVAKAFRLSARFRLVEPPDKESPE